MMDISLKCSELVDLVHLSLAGPGEDYVGLFEQYWAIDDGDIYDDVLNLSKKYPFQLIADLNRTLGQKGYLAFGILSGQDFSTKTDLEFLGSRENWLPFQIDSGRGYVVTITDKGNRLLSNLSNRRGFPGLHE